MTCQVVYDHFHWGLDDHLANLRDRDQDVDHAAKKNHGKRLLPAEALVQHGAGHGVGGHADDHADPQRRVVLGGPVALGGGGGKEILVGESVLGLIHWGWVL